MTHKAPQADSSAGIDAAVAAAIASANDALGAIKNGPLMDARSELCWACHATAACSVDEARTKIAAAMEDLRQALVGASHGRANKPGGPTRAIWRLPFKWKQQFTSAG